MGKTGPCSSQLHCTALRTALLVVEGEWDGMGLDLAISGLSSQYKPRQLPVCQDTHITFHHMARANTVDAVQIITVQLMC